MSKNNILLLILSFACLQVRAQDTLWSKLTFEEFSETVSSIGKGFESSEGYYSYTVSSYSGQLVYELIDQTQGFYFNNGKIKFTTMMDIEQLTDDSCSFVKLKQDQELFIQSASSNSNQIPIDGWNYKDFKSLQNNISLKKGIVGKHTCLVFNFNDETYSYEIRYYLEGNRTLQEIYWNKALLKTSNELETSRVSSKIEKVSKKDIQARLSALGYSQLTREEFLFGTENYKVYDLRY